MIQSLNLISLAIFSRKDVIEALQVQRAVHQLLERRANELELETLGNFVRFMIVSKVKDLLKPAELTQDGNSSSEIAEARIMLSDLFSGGLQLSKYSLFEEEALSEMLDDAQFGKEEELLRFLEHALSHKRS